MGDVNNIRCPKIHAKVFCYLYEIWHKLDKVTYQLLNNFVDTEHLPCVLSGQLHIWAARGPSQWAVADVYVTRTKAEILNLNGPLSRCMDICLHAVGQSAKCCSVLMGCS